jgi:hypothetical protein
MIMPEETKQPEKPTKYLVNATSLRQQEALEAVIGERAYQDTRWNAKTTASEGKHSVTEFIVFIEHYLANAKRILSTDPEPRATEQALHDIRKVASLAVVAMEQNGVRKRQVPEVKK